MAEIKIAGILRSGAFSPNHIGNDAAIMNVVAEQLRKRSCEVNLYSEEQLAQGAVSEKYVLSMCRDPRSIDILRSMEDEGRLVINSGYGIENCVRERLARIFAASGIPYPQSFVVDTDEVVKNRLAKAGINDCWIKRADRHTMHREDVTYARHAQEAQEILQEFFLRGIKKAVISRHVSGVQVKYYGVAGTPFFHWFYHRNANTAGVNFNPERLQQICAKAADLLDIKIYGGDCIVAEDGSITIIDFSDWPSFVPCRNEAAPIIARMVMSEFKNKK